MDLQIIGCIWSRTPVSIEKRWIISSISLHAAMVQWSSSIFSAAGIHFSPLWCYCRPADLACMWPQLVLSNVSNCKLNWDESGLVTFECACGDQVSISSAFESIATLHKQALLHHMILTHDYYWLLLLCWYFTNKNHAWDSRLSRGESLQNSTNEITWREWTWPLAWAYFKNWSSGRQLSHSWVSIWNSFRIASFNTPLKSHDSPMNYNCLVCYPKLTSRLYSIAVAWNCRQGYGCKMPQLLQWLGYCNNVAGFSVALAPKDNYTPLCSNQPIYKPDQLADYNEKNGSLLLIWSGKRYMADSGSFNSTSSSLEKIPKRMAHFCQGTTQEYTFSCTWWSQETAKLCQLLSAAYPCQSVATYSTVAAGPQFRLRLL